MKLLLRWLITAVALAVAVKNPVATAANPTAVHDGALRSAPHVRKSREL